METELPSERDTNTKKLIVAVHGIGDQYHYATIQGVARRIAGYFGEPVGIPLGSFHSQNEKIRALPFEGKPNVLLGEIYWAHIPRNANKDEDTLEETKAWAETVIQRVRSVDRNARKADRSEKRGKTSVDYEKASAVVADMIGTIEILENLTFLAAKAGLMEFNLRQVLDDYLGDVQIVAEFENHGGEIFREFQSTMGQLASSAGKDAEIHLVAHSEGTVVTFKGLLEAFVDSENNQWVKQVKSLMTIGSPIDKHLVFWPKLWAGLISPPEKGPGTAAIAWWNYYDIGDPVGFELDTARQWLLHHGWMEKDSGRTHPDGTLVPASADKQKFFHFPEQHDIGFLRYPLPGKSHNDYWEDQDLFDFHLAGAVKLLPTKPVKKPTTKWVYVPVSWVTPYIIAWIMLAGGTYLVFKSVGEVIGAPMDGGGLARNVLGMTAFLAGITVTSRLPRLIPVSWWYLLPAVLFRWGHTHIGNSSMGGRHRDWVKRWVGTKAQPLTAR